MGGVDAGRLDIANSSGTVVGTQYVTLTSAEMPSHTHTQDSHNHTQNSHNHTQNSHGHGTANASAGGAFGQISLQGTGSGPYTVVEVATSVRGSVGNHITFAPQANTATNIANTATNIATTATNQNTGGGGAHNNMQPTMVLNYIIKA
jgi:microcystin-dependent protein